MAKQEAMLAAMHLVNPTTSTLLGQHCLATSPEYCPEIQTASVNSEKKAIPVTSHESSTARIETSALPLMSAQRLG